MDEPRPVDAFIAVGSNIEPERNVPRALECLMRRVEVTGVSTLYRTAALGRPEQAPFINGVWRIKTAIGPRELKFRVLRSVEGELGRVRTEDTYAPRTIDLDIAVYGELVVDEQDLVVPDPDIAGRPFLAVPLVELEPGIHVPGMDRPLADCRVARERGGLEPLPELTALLREKLHR